MSYKKKVQTLIAQEANNWEEADTTLTLEAKDDLSHLAHRFFSGIFGTYSSSLSVLHSLLLNHNISRNNRLIFLSNIAKALKILWAGSEAESAINGSKDRAICNLAKLAALLPVVYDVRTGSKPGCVYKHTYTKKNPAPYNENACIYYFPETRTFDQPAMDCSGFVSWCYFTLGLHHRAINENTETIWPSDVKHPGGSGVYNILKSPLNQVIFDGYAYPGDLIYFKGHIGIVTETADGVVTAITHSSPKYSTFKSGVRTETIYNATEHFKYLMGLTKDLVKHYAAYDIVSKDAPAVLTRIVY